MATVAAALLLACSGASENSAGADAGTAPTQQENPPARQSSPAWSAIGPGGGFVQRVVIDPTGRAYALGFGGLFRSTDGGASWSDTGLTVPAETFLTVLALSPVDSNRLWAGDAYGNLWRTEDRGASWQPLQQPIDSLNDLTPDPRDASTIYAATPRGLYVSHDAGASFAFLWNPTFVSGDPETGVCALAFDSAYAMYSGPCGDSQTGGVMRSTDGGATWARLMSPLAGDVTAIGISRAGVIYASFNSAGPAQILYSTDGGVNWLPAPDYTAYDNVPLTARTFGFAADGSVYASLRYAGLYQTTDGAHYSAVTQGLPSDGFSAWLAVGPSGAQLLGVSGSNGGGVYSRQGGGWASSSKGLHLETVNGVVSQGGNLFAATGDGLFTSSDGGGSWSQTGFSGGAFSVALSPKGDALYVAGEQQLFTSSDAGATFAAHDSPGSHAPVVVAPSGRIYSYDVSVNRSDDGGATWTVTSQGGYIESLALDPTDGQRLYAWSQGDTHDSAGNLAYANYGLRISSDGGDSWSAAGAGLPDSVNSGGVAVDASGAVYVAIDAAIYRSSDGGQSWSLFAQPADPILAITCRDNDLFYATRGGVFKGASQIGPGNASITSLYSDGGALYAATAGHSLLRLDD